MVLAKRRSRWKALHSNQRQMHPCLEITPQPGRRVVLQLQVHLLRAQDPRDHRLQSEDAEVQSHNQSSPHEGPQRQEQNLRPLKRRKGTPKRRLP